MVMHCGTGSERGLYRVPWKPRYGNLTRPSRNLQVERWESVIIGREYSICKGMGISVLRKYNWSCPGHLKVVNIQNS